MILVTGATGQVGREVVAQLVAAGEPVRAMTRHPERANLPAQAQVVQGDLDQPSTLPAALAGVSKVYLFLGQDLGKGLLDAARAAGVKHVVLLSSLTTQGAHNAIAQRHLLGEEAVRASGLPWTFLQPGGFASNNLQWAPSIRAEGVVRAPFVQARSALIDPKDIAAVAVAALRSPGHEGKNYPMTGSEALSVVEQVRTLSEVLGRDIRLEELTEEAARQASLQRHVPVPIIDALLSLGKNSLGRPPVILDTVQKITGRPARTFRQWASDHADAFR